MAGSVYNTHNMFSGYIPTYAEFIKKSAERPYHVYVVKLKQEALKRKEDKDSGKIPVYVGMTGHTPENRFIKHKSGIKANSLVHNYGIELMPDLYSKYNPMTYDKAFNKEQELANELRDQGFIVYGGNPPAKPAIKKGEEADDIGDRITDAVKDTLPDYVKERGNNWGKFDAQRKSSKVGTGVIPQSMFKDYQQRVIKRMADPKTRGLVVAHGMGTGKTLSSIGTYNKLKVPTTVVPPAALIGNYEKEIGKWMGRQPANLNIESQQRAAVRGLEHDPKNGLLIVDEAHKARANTSKLLAALQDSEAKKRMLLTGTPIVNHPRDLSTLINFVAHKNLLPTNVNDFNKEYFDQKEISPPFIQRLLGVKPGIGYELKNKIKLKKILDQYVDYQPAAQEGFPSVNQEEVKVPMAENQMKIYKTILGKTPFWVRWKVKSGLPPGKGEFDTMRAFLGGLRQVSNTTQGFTTRNNELEYPKIQKAFDYLKGQVAKNQNYKAVVYSNYLKSGLDPYKKLLDRNHIPYGEFSGEVSPAVRNQMVKDYNANKLKALLISSAGAEGLDLKKTRLIQLIEPHFNEEKEKQIIGRGARYMSHAGLPYDQQNLLVQRYLSTPKTSFLDRLLGTGDVKGTDEYIRQMAMQKDQLNKQVMELMNPEAKKKSTFW